MKVAVVYGSVRAKRVGIRAAYFIRNQLKKRKHTVTLIDPLKEKLPLLDKMYKEFPKGNAPKTMRKLARIFKRVDACIIVSAEYNHCIPPALSNLIDHFMEEYFWKPAGIVSYSVGGFGGVRASMQLRTLLPEVGMPTIPTIFSISKVHETLDEKGKDITENYEKRIGRFFDELEWYASACKEQRKKGVPY